MISIALIQPEVVRDWEKGNTERISTLVNKNVQLNKFELVKKAIDADLIILLESCIFKTQRNIKDFEKLLHFNKGSKRLCTLNYEDSPPGFLPGLYSSLEAFKFDPSIHISWPHLVLPNEQINEADAAGEVPVTMLFTFSGSCSNPVRRKIFDLYKSCPGKYKVTEIKKWYNHTLAEKKSYIDDIRQSKFVLCPKGIASYSHRITETLALGKVPVVIADDWVPFSVPEKDYFVRIRESDLSNLVQMLEQKEDVYETLNTNAVNVYQKYFNPQFCYSIALNQLAELYARQLLNMDSAYIRHRWNSRKFWKNNRWCIEDRVMRKINKMIKPA
jgi:hypothetical protein